MVAVPSAVISGFLWMISAHSYIVDLIVSQQPLLAWWSLAMLMLVCCCRRWRGALLVLGFCMLAFYPLVYTRTLLLPEVDSSAKAKGTIRIVSCNINPKSEQWERAAEELMKLDADVVILIEVPPDLTRLIRRQGWVGNQAYAQWAHRPWVDGETSPGFILSVWPIQRLSVDVDADSMQQVLHVRIDHPDGPFIAGLMHPFSPRDHDRWRYGNEVTRLQGHAANLTRSIAGLPMIFGVDLNAGPGQFRARMLRRAGLRQHKPLMRVGGSYPAGGNVPSALAVQLDDVWTLGSVHASAWSSIRVSGSDHRAVVVDLVVD